MILNCPEVYSQFTMVPQEGSPEASSLRSRYYRADHVVVASRYDLPEQALRAAGVPLTSPPLARWWCASPATPTLRDLAWHRMCRASGSAAGQTLL